jgi:hypothetical protein
MANPFVAEIRMFADNFASTGWALCNGQLMPISQNTALFSLLGTTYGGDGKNNFALPNLQGSAPMHPGQGPGLSLHDLGEKRWRADRNLAANRNACSQPFGCLPNEHCRRPKHSYPVGQDGRGQPPAAAA